MARGSQSPKRSSTAPSGRENAWWAALEARHLAELSFAEVRRGAQALSAQYVAGRGRLADGAAFSGRGKRAAFALLYTPLHYLLVQHVVRSLQLAAPAHIVDAGCGTGAAGAAWAQASLASGHAPSPTLDGIDRNAWALAEARWNWQQLGLRGRVRRGDVLSAAPGITAAGIVLGWVVNELEAKARDTLLERVLLHHAHGHTVLVVEPIARRMMPWWPSWQAAFAARGGGAHEHRLEAQLPTRVTLLGRAMGHDYRVLTCRSLHLAPASTGG